MRIPAHFAAWSSAGVLHRDISIGNVLFLKDGRRTVQPIEETMGDCPSLSSNNYRRHLALLVKRYPTFAKCYGYVIDGDMAIELKLYFENKEYRGSRSVYWFYFFYQDDDGTEWMIGNG